MSLALVEAIAPPVEANAAKKNKDPKRIKYTLSQRNKRHIRKIQELQEEFHDQNIPSISAVVLDGKIQGGKVLLLWDILFMMAVPFGKSSKLSLAAKKRSESVATITKPSLKIPHNFKILGMPKSEKFILLCCCIAACRHSKFGSDGENAENSCER